MDSRADIDAFGIIAYELLCGHVPFQYENITKLLIAHLQELPEPLVRARPAHLTPLPSRLAQFSMRCLEKDRDARPLRLSEFGRVVDAALASLPEEAPRLPSTSQEAAGSVSGWLPTMYPEDPSASFTAASSLSTPSTPTPSTPTPTPASKPAARSPLRCYRLEQLLLGLAVGGGGEAEVL